VDFRNEARRAVTARRLVPIVLCALATVAHADQEYVDPVFCYRVVLPDAAARTVRHDDGAVSFDVAGPCPGAACIRLDIASAYHGAPLPSGSLARATGTWRAVSRSVRDVAGQRWELTRRTLGDRRAQSFEYTHALDGSRHVVTVLYMEAGRAQALDAAHAVLASWRWVSACL